MAQAAAALERDVKELDVRCCRSRCHAMRPLRHLLLVGRQKLLPVPRCIRSAQDRVREVEGVVQTLLQWVRLPNASFRPATALTRAETTLCSSWLNVDCCVIFPPPQLESTRGGLSGILGGDRESARVSGLEARLDMLAAAMTAPKARRKDAVGWTCHLRTPRVPPPLCLCCAVMAAALPWSRCCGVVCCAPASCRRRLPRA